MSTESINQLEDRELQIIWVSGYYSRDHGRQPGGFYELLIKCFFSADSNNFQRLKSAFPITAQAYESYMSGKLNEKYNLPED